MDLVVGGTGVVGGQIARGLAAAGRRVRALVRRPDSHPRARELAEAGLELIDGDLTRAETLGPACEGVEVVVCTATSMPHGREDGLRRVDLEGVKALVDAAEEAGVRKFVYISYSGNIRRDSPLHVAKRGCERRLREADLRAVILRPSFFAEVWLSPAVGFDPLAGSVRIYGPGDRPVSYISAADVAEFGMAAVGAEFEEDAALELGGPDALSQLDAVRVFEEVLGRRLEVEQVPAEALQEQHRSPDPVQKSFAALMLALAEGDPIPTARDTARRFGISLRSVADHARTLAPG